jgi:hypothetical protein
VKEATPPALTVQQQLWIDYNALGGLITDDTQDWKDKDGNLTPMRKMSIIEFAQMIDVSRETLRLWRTQIPDFWGKVNARRKELAPQSRLAQVHRKWYIEVLKMKNWPMVEAWLINNDPTYETPKVKHELDVGDNLADLLLAAKRDGIIEGEVVNAPSNDPGAGGQNPGLLPSAS